MKPLFDIMSIRRKGKRNLADVNRNDKVERVERECQAQNLIEI